MYEKGEQVKKTDEMFCVRYYISKFFGGFILDLENKTCVLSFGTI